MNEIELKALRYVKNTKSSATVNDFIEDHDPIGRTLWGSLTKQGLVTTLYGHIVLTVKGSTALRSK